MGMMFLVAVLFVVFSNGVEAQTCTVGTQTGTCIDENEACATPLSGATGCSSSQQCCSSGSSSATTCKSSNCYSGTSCPSERPNRNTQCEGSLGKVCGSGQIYCEASSSSSGTTTTGSAASISLPNPLKYNTVQEVLTALLHALQAVIVTLALVFLVIGAVLYITSAGNQGRLTLAKGAITAALIGLAIGILAPTFLKEIANALGWGSTDIPTEVQNAPTAATILLNVLNFLLGIVGVLAIIFLVIGGSMYLGAAGNPSQIDKAKGVVKYSLVGIVVALASLVFVRQIAAFFAGS